MGLGRLGPCLTLLAALCLGSALAATPDTVTLPDGVVVKSDLPGYPRGNGGSYGENHPDKILICHATSAVDTNGFVVISVSRQAYEAHMAHEHLNQNGNKQKRDELYYNGFTCTRAPT